MNKSIIPKQLPNWIAGREFPSQSGAWFEDINPATGEPLCQAARSNASDIDLAVDTARKAHAQWAAFTPVKRGEVLYQIIGKFNENAETIAKIVSLETGKSMKDALGETFGAIALGQFYAGEGQRLYARTTTSGVANRMSMTVRQPLGVAGLIIAANTPIANVAWKMFPALICGNAAVMKSAEDTPATAWIAGLLAHQTELPNGALNFVHGYGEEAGSPLVDHPGVDVISFTGSSKVGKEIAMKAGQRMARVSLELGGKNPLVVCDDADLNNAAKWILLSAYSNAGQRCAAASRIIVFDSVYEPLKALLLERISKLRVGAGDQDDLGPVINEKQLTNMLGAIQRALDEGASLLAGGNRMDGEAHKNGFYMAPTLLENADRDAELSKTELFGPIACLYRAGDFAEAMDLANDSPYGLTACIHTKSHHRAMRFAQSIQSGVAVVNAGTYGSEPHMPFGGVKLSGNGSREPGTEALDIYSNLKDVYFNYDPEQL